MASCTGSLSDVQGGCLVTYLLVLHIGTKNRMNAEWTVWGVKVLGLGKVRGSKTYDSFSFVEAENNKISPLPLAALYLIEKNQCKLTSILLN